MSSSQTDALERRRIQNKMAQRRFRSKKSSPNNTEPPTGPLTACPSKPPLRPRPCQQTVPDSNVSPASTKRPNPRVKPWNSPHPEGEGKEQTGHSADMTPQIFQGQSKSPVNNTSQTSTLTNVDLFQMTPEDMVQEYEYPLVLQSMLDRQGWVLFDFRQVNKEPENLSMDWPSPNCMILTPNECRPPTDLTSLNPSYVQDTSHWKLKSPAENPIRQMDHEMMFSAVTGTDNGLWSPATASLTGDDVNYFYQKGSKDTSQSPGVPQVKKPKQLEPVHAQQPTPPQLSRRSSQSALRRAQSEDDTEQDRNSDTDFANSNEDTFQTVLHIAAEGGHDSLISMLLESGVGVDERDSEGNTALHRATQNDRMLTVEKLLEHGANPNAVNVIGCTPVHLAASLGSVEMVQLLVRHGADLFKKARGIP